MSQSLQNELEETEAMFTQYQLGMVRLRELQLTSVVPKEYAREFHALVGTTVLTNWALDTKIEALKAKIVEEQLSENDTDLGD